jgi:hypothetical protein
MILTILKQTTRFHLDEKDYEVANLYADMYCKMIVQYLNKPDQAIVALRDLAFDFFIIGHYRSAKKYYLELKEHYGHGAFLDEDLMHFAETLEKLRHTHEALLEYQYLIRMQPHSPYIAKSLRHIISICDECSNKNKAQLFRDLYSDLKQNKDRKILKQYLPAEESETLR